MVLSGIENGNVSFVQGLPRALKAVVYLVCHIQATGACKSRKSEKQSVS